MEYNSDYLADIRTSLGLVVNFSQALNSEGQNPVCDYMILKQLYFDDPIISSAVDLKAEAILSNGYAFRGKNKRDIDKAYKMFDELNAYELFLNFIKVSECFGDVYVEPRFIDGTSTLNELHVLETPITRIDYNINGKVIKYIQKFEDKKNTWEADELFHYSDITLGSNVYSYPSLLSSQKSISTRILGNHYVMQIFKNLPPMMVHILKSASKKQLVQYKSTLLASKGNVNQSMVVRTPPGTEGVDIKQFIVDFTKGGIMEVLSYFRQEILVRMRVPPTLLGLSDASGRPEPQMFVFEAHLKTKQRRIAKFVNTYIMPAMGLPNVEFYFPSVMIGSEEKVMSVARSMIDAGLYNEGDKHPALVLLRERGFNIPDGTTLKDPKEKDIDTMPSRKRKGMKEGKAEEDNRNSEGDSDESKEKIDRASIRHSLTNLFKKKS